MNLPKQVPPVFLISILFNKHSHDTEMMLDIILLILLKKTGRSEELRG